MKSILSIAVAGVFVAGCGTMGAGSGPSATAKLEPTSGNSAQGAVTFTQQGDRVHVSGRLTGLSADGVHGFHVHEKGDCSSGDGMSAGGHFNPAGKPHGAPTSDHHAGDIPNVKADYYGNAELSFDLTGVSIGSGAADLVGHGLIVHRDADDYKTQPTGNSGARIACGVITRN